MSTDTTTTTPETMPLEGVVLPPDFGADWQNPDLLASLARFNGLNDRSAKPIVTTWPILTQWLQRSAELARKEDGLLFAPAVFDTDDGRATSGKPWSENEGMWYGTRKAGNVFFVTALVLDLEDKEGRSGCLNPDELLSGYEALWEYEFFAYSTHSDEVGKPRCRVIVPLSFPFSIKDWREKGVEWDDAYRAAAEQLTGAGGAWDRATTDASRMYFLPSHRPGANPWHRLNYGTLLSPHAISRWALEAAAVRALEPTPANRLRALPTPAGGTDRPGDDFSQRADFLGMLLKDGWTVCRQQGDDVLLARPGKDRRDGHSGVLHTASNVFYVFTDASELEPNDAYTAFRYLTETAFNGDHSACARDLRRQGYGAERLPLRAPERLIRLPEPGGAICEVGPVHNTDLGNAQRLVVRHGKDLRHCLSLGWVIWDGKRWQRDETGEVERRAKETVRAIYSEAAAAGDTQRPELAKWALQSENITRIRAMIELAKSEPGIPVRIEELDANPYILNCQNGTIDLKTGALREHRREDLCSQLAPVEFDANATCPAWDRFLFGIMDGSGELVDFLQRLSGYSISGDVSEQVIPFLHGSGSNGKSTFLNCLQSILGDYATTAPPGLLVETRSERHPTELATLKGRRFVASVEIDEGAKLAEGLVKQLSGSDRISARLMHQNFFQFAPQHKIWLAVNHQPIIRGTDHAIWRRIPLIPFTVTFTDNDPNPARRKDRALGEKLLRELPGILAWAVRGCLAWQRDGLEWPEAVRAASAEYRSESDLLGQFIGECCTMGEGLFVSCSDLYRSYCAWCEAQGLHPMTQTSLGKKFGDRGFPAAKSGDVRRRRGIALAGSPVSGWDGVMSFGTSLGQKQINQSEAPKGEIPENRQTCPPGTKTRPGATHTRPSPTICRRCGHDDVDGIGRSADGGTYCINTSDCRRREQGAGTLAWV